MPSADDASVTEDVGVQFTIEGITSTKEERVRAFPPHDLTTAALSNSTKEDLCLEYVENFRKQFMDMFPSHEQLMLVAPNEADVPKYLCTTVRPTQLPFKELYDVDACAAFLAKYFIYEPLEHPMKHPTHIPSPAVVLDWRIGDCYDLSILLCSFLLGNGYDAYVVMGIAPRWITLKDQRRVACPFDEKDFSTRVLDESAASNSRGSGGGKKQDDGDDEPPEKYKPGYKGVPQSDFEKTVTLRSSEEEKKAAESAAGADDEIAPLEPEDPLKGKRRHAWVLIRAGTRDIEEHTFVEPSTGATFEVATSPYERVDAVFNSKNYWVNMQGWRPALDTTTASLPPAPTAVAPPAGGAGAGAGAGAGGEGGEGEGEHVDPAQLDYDLNNTHKWEFVFIDSAARAAAAAEEAKGDAAENEGEHDEDGAGLGLEGALGATIDLTGGGGAKTDEAEEEDAEHILDLPPSWVPELHLDRDAYGASRFGPQGSRTILYDHSKLDIFAPRRHPEGLVARLQTFSDFQRAVLVEQVEIFHSRSDKLVKRIRNPLQMRVEEQFAPGREMHLKKHVEIMGKWRRTDFYAAARLDGLVYREDKIGVKMVEEFQDRPDRLTYRSVTFVPEHGRGGGAGGARGGRAAGKTTHFSIQGEAGQELVMRKMAEKFSRNPDVEADRDVAKRTYFVQDKTIREDYHFADGRITCSSRMYHKDATDGQHVQLLSTNPFATQMKDSELDADFRKAVALEKDCSHAVREASREIYDLLKDRAKEQLSIEIEKSIFEIAREKSKDDALKAADADEEEKESKQESKVDYLTPFLQKCDDPSQPTREEAIAADRACRKALKERLIERVNIIQRRLDEENGKMAKRQAAFQRSQREQLGEGAEEEFERFCAESMFRIGVLENRLQRQEETVLSKFTELEMMLKADPRLQVIYGDNSMGDTPGRGRK